MHIDEIPDDECIDNCTHTKWYAFLPRRQCNKTEVQQKDFQGTQKDVGMVHVEAKAVNKQGKDCMW